MVHRRSDPHPEYLQKHNNWIVLQQEKKNHEQKPQFLTAKTLAQFQAKADLNSLSFAVTSSKKKTSLLNKTQRLLDFSHAMTL